MAALPRAVKLGFGRGVVSSYNGLTRNLHHTQSSLLLQLCLRGRTLQNCFGHNWMTKQAKKAKQELTNTSEIDWILIFDDGYYSL